MPIRDYVITFHGHKLSEPMVYIKNRFVNARQWVEKLMMGLESGEKIIIERKGTNEKWQNESRRRNTKIQMGKIERKGK